MIAALLLSLLAAQPAGASAAEPAPLTLAPGTVRPGDALLVRVRAPAASGTLADRPLRFFAHGDEQWALAALPIETPPGPLPVSVEIAGARALAAALAVVEPGFPSKTLHVAPRFVAPPASVKARIARDRAAIAAALARPFAPPLFSASFAWPHPGGHHGRYGDQRTFNGKKESVHYGLDIDAARGAPVHAANDGEVVLARDCYFSGNTVIVWHGADLYTMYFHMDRLDVAAGAKVARGDRLGVVGSTGRSTGPHLHWSAKIGDRYVDPESLMGIDFVAGTARARHAGPPAGDAARPEPVSAELPPEAAGTAVSGAAPPR